ncbi:MAG: DUF1499 domain-containing protein [Pseudomonadota bacterium]
MRLILAGVLVLAVACLAFSAYVRLAPTDVAAWTVLPDDPQAGDGPGSATRIVDGDARTFARLDKIARATPRTRVLAGSTQAGMITYVTRSAVMGFPDYTTVALRDGKLILYARLRFGHSDMGVNALRLDSWLAALRN